MTGYPETTKKPLANPFQPAPGARPPILAGREAELTSIRDATSRLESGSAPVTIAMTGLRGMGKTALLSELASRLDGERTSVLRLEAERDAPFASVLRAQVERARRDSESLPKRIGGAVDKLLARIPAVTYDLPDHLGSVALRTASSPDANSEAILISDVVTLFNEGLHAQGRALAVLVDEVQDADTAAFGSIAAAVHQSASGPMPILLAVAGLPQSETLLRRIHTYTQRWDHLKLEFLTRAEVVRAVRDPIAQAGVTIEDRAVDRLADECAGYPYFVQLFASAVWNERSGRVITSDDVEKAIRPVRDKIDRTFYRETLDRLTEREVRFVIAMSELGPGPQRLADLSSRLGVRSEQIGSVRTNLIKKDIIISPGPRLLEFRIPLLDRYVREHAAELSGER